MTIDLHNISYEISFKAFSFQILRRENQEQNKRQMLKGTNDTKCGVESTKKSIVDFCTYGESCKTIEYTVNCTDFGEYIVNLVHELMGLE